ncbi:MAG: protein kinase domain-containing protein [Bryobacteraceae bacterium]
MPLSAGTRLGPYEILAPIGAGGMGEVYRARDTKLECDVAIKVLPAVLAQGPERLARFEREAKVLASLNHPNIAQIYGIEDRALIMELVDGATLQGPLPLDTALNYARQIADAPNTIQNSSRALFESWLSLHGRETSPYRMYYSGISVRPILAQLRILPG